MSINFVSFDAEVRITPIGLNKSHITEALTRGLTKIAVKPPPSGVGI